jgi:hypothetical protein
MQQKLCDLRALGGKPDFSLYLQYEMGDYEHRLLVVFYTKLSQAGRQTVRASLFLVGPSLLVVGPSPLLLGPLLSGGQHDAVIIAPS